MDGELVMTEVGLSRSGGDDQAVVRDVCLLADRVEHHFVRAEVDVLDLSEQRPRVGLVAQHVTDRRGDVSLREYAGSHLVQQRLEQVVVVAVHDCHIDRRPPQRTRGEQAAEPRPDDHHAVARGMGISVGAHDR